jgi:hypothetical protein
MVLNHRDLRRMVTMNKYFKILTLFFITTFVMSKNSNAQGLPKIGDVWAGTVDSSSKIYLPSPYGFEDKIEFQHDGVKFHGAIYKGKVIGISTNDALFEINKVRYMDKPLSYFKNKDKIKLSIGWGHYLPLEEGWYAAFDFNHISDTSKVTFLFKLENFL